MKNPKFDKLLSVFCWFGVVLVGFLEGYLLYTLYRFPEVGDTLRRNALLAGVLLLVWIAAAVYFTIRAKKNK